MNHLMELELIHSLVEKFCDNINIMVPDTREDMMPIVDRMFNIGLISCDERENYINHYGKASH